MQRLECRTFYRLLLLQLENPVKIVLEALASTVPLFSRASFSIYQPLVMHTFGLCKNRLARENNTNVAHQLCRSEGRLWSAHKVRYCGDEGSGGGQVHPRAQKGARPVGAAAEQRSGSSCTARHGRARGTPPPC